VEKRKGFKVIKTFKEDEPIVSTCIFKDRLYVATSCGIYRLRDDDTLEKIELVERG
jgi:hypothetical protein